nr:MAG TPA: hypothetical protein [Caudoviricetes sp.]DAQ18562.1 MAG TPA: hypothetical protein [Caudoviricetes sp.]DAR26066.1 MAG TPA: hypothetical protein [Caudoviricetes sp.]DAX54700.1 MAG TPA: hypothetical protein [Caudoviricetes sp.]
MTHIWFLLIKLAIHIYKSYVCCYFSFLAITRLVFCLLR